MTPTTGALIGWEIPPLNFDLADLPALYDWDTGGDWFIV